MLIPVKCLFYRIFFLVFVFLIFSGRIVCVGCASRTCARGLRGEGLYVWLYRGGSEVIEGSNDSVLSPKRCHPKTPVHVGAWVAMRSLDYVGCRLTSHKNSEQVRR